MPFDSAAYLGALAQGNRAMFAGITSAGNSIATKIEQTQAESKRLKAFRAMAVDGLGMDPDEVDQMDSDTLQGKLEAVAVKSHVAKAQAEAEDQAYQQMQRQAGAQFQQRLARIPGIDGGGVNPAGPTVANATPAPLTPEHLMQAASETGYQLPPAMLSQMMRENSQTDWNAVMPHPFEIDGVRGAVGKSGQFQFLPQTTPDSLQSIPVLDDQGNVLGYRVPTGKGGSAPAPKQTTKTLPDSYNSRLSLLQDELKAAETTASKTDDELKKLKLQPQSYYKTAAKNAAKAISDHVARFQEQGYADDNFWKSEKQRLGLGGSAPAASGRVTVTKGGKQFTVPASQLDAAKQQGYSEVK